MTLTLKDSSQINGTGKPGALNQETQNKTASASRANPVCLDVGVTIRSLPGEQGSLPQPLREEARTVIVFDNGAVLRSSNNLPGGLKVILTNSKGRDVVCKVAEGRNIPAVKGYVELEFVEPVSDFWQIHQGVAPVVPPPPPTLMPEAPSNERPSSAPEPSRPVEPTKVDGASANQSSGNAPSFEDIAGVVKMAPSGSKREPRLDRAAPADKTGNKAEATHVIAETSRTAFAPPRSASVEPTKNESAKRGTSGVSLIPPKTQSQAADFMSKGLLTSAPLESSSWTRPRRTPLILAVLALSGAAVGVYIWRGGVVSLPDLNALLGRGPSSPAPAAATPAPEPVQSAQQAESRMPAATPVRPAAEESNQPRFAPPQPVEPKVTAPKDEARTDRQTVKNQSATKRTEPVPSQPPALSNLKLKSPTSPGRRLANPGEEAAPPADTASANTANGAPPSGLLTTTASHPTAPSAPAPAFPAATTAPASAVPAATIAQPPKVATEPRLISSTRPVYPVAARESNIQGSVVIRASIDEKGNVVAVKAVSGAMFLRQAALDSVKQWKYSPATLDGKPAPSEVAVNVEFRLK